MDSLIDIQSLNLSGRRTTRPLFVTCGNISPLVVEFPIVLHWVSCRWGTFLPLVALFRQVAVPTVEPFRLPSGGGIGGDEGEDDLGDEARDEWHDCDGNGGINFDLLLIGLCEPGCFWGEVWGWVLSVCGYGDDFFVDVIDGVGLW